ncbi:arginine--tRNA ligase [Salvia divinorum]|uniref:arginine--tRNA ligase n=1 Tax=Salvia divinorum TaxID=28513 RepID=A0ABD1FN58_SALDI
MNSLHFSLLRAGSLSSTALSPLPLSPPFCLPNLSTYCILRTSKRIFFRAKASSLTSMKNDQGIAGSPKQQLAKLFEVSLRVTAPEELDIDPAIAPCQNPKFGDYQCNNAMGLWSKVKGKSTQYKNPQQIGQAIKANLPASDMIDESSIAGPGFVNVKLSEQWIAKCIQNMLMDGIEMWAPKLSVKRAVVDFSSPNIAKEMHVGHLRSTIIGDTLARMLEYSNVEVLRRNHVGDWGTQFGMLIEFLFEKFPSLEVVNDQAIGDLEAFYKASKLRFDSDPAFKERAQRAVVSLQAGEEKYRKAWAEICNISRSGYEKVYEHLGVQLEEKGESFYNPYIPNALELLNKEGLIEESEGARVIFVEGKKIPLIVVKRDGGYNYASTDLAALWYRLNEEKAEWIIYLTDVGQREHFEMLFAAAKRAGWLPAGDSKYPKASHVGFGLVLGEDGKRFRTRSTETVKLVDLLIEAKTRCKTALIERGKDKEWTEEELDKTAEAVGYGAVKYADLKNNRTTNYTFSFDQMLNDKGNTAVYLLYAHARICSIIRKSGKDIEELKKTGKIDLAHPGERILGLHLLQFAEVVEESCTNLLPNGLCEYLYNLSEYFTGFYTNCQVVGSAEETSRLLLCEATSVVMRKCFHLLGITPVYKI